MLQWIWVSRGESPSTKQKANEPEAEKEAKEICTILPLVFAPSTYFAAVNETTAKIEAIQVRRIALAFNDTIDSLVHTRTTNLSLCGPTRKRGRKARRN